MSNILSPSILAADFTVLGEQIAACERAGAQYLHFDVMDGRFVPNISIGLPVLESVRRVTNMLLDVHLMIVDPAEYAARFIKAGADILTFQLESLKDSISARALISRIKSEGAKASIAIKPATDISVVFPYVQDLDMILIMSVEPGFGGQKLMPECLQKARALRDYLDRERISCDIEMDGGITLKNARDVIASGVNVVVTGTSVFRSKNIEESTRAFLSAINP